MSRSKRKSGYARGQARSVVLDEERLYQIILKPVISEKSTGLADKHSQVVFQVKTDARKDEIRQAVEKLFAVKVKRVQVVNVRGKVKRFGKTPGARSSWKKAYVCLQDGQDIDFLGMAAA